LYSAVVAAGLTGAPHLLQNRESGDSSAPHDPHKSPAAVSAPRPSPVPSTSISCHRWSAMSVISPCHLRGIRWAGVSTALLLSFSAVPHAAASLTQVSDRGVDVGDGSGGEQ